MFAARDYDQALLTPQKIFDLPMEVVETESLTAKQKLKVLKRWEADAHDLEVASGRASVKFAGRSTNYANAKVSTRRASTCFNASSKK